MTHRAHLPGSPAYNGRPVRRNYRYQGDGEDLRPDLTDADLEPYRVDYSHLLPKFDRGSNAPRRPGCGYAPGKVNCRILCGAR